MAIAINNKLGMILLSVYLIATGLQAFIGLQFNGSNYVMGGLALAAGVVLLLKR